MRGHGRTGTPSTSAELQWVEKSLQNTKSSILAAALGLATSNPSLSWSSSHKFSIKCHGRNSLTRSKADITERNNFGSEPRQLKNYQWNLVDHRRGTRLLGVYEDLARVSKHAKKTRSSVRAFRRSSQSALPLMKNNGRPKWRQQAHSNPKSPDTWWLKDTSRVND